MSNRYCGNLIISTTLGIEVGLELELSNHISGHVIDIVDKSMGDSDSIGDIMEERISELTWNE